MPDRDKVIEVIAVELDDLHDRQMQSPHLSLYEAAKIVKALERANLILVQDPRRKL